MSDVDRRTVLGAAAAGVAAVSLTACSKAEKPESPATPAPGQSLAAAAEIPVGSGVVADGTLITQPTAGVFKGFVARCTHAGCALSTVTDGKAVCPCHGSAFGLDGEVLRGPATEALPTRAVTVRDGQIVVSNAATPGSPAATRPASS